VDVLTPHARTAVSDWRAARQPLTLYLLGVVGSLACAYAVVSGQHLLLEAVMLAAALALALTLRAELFLPLALLLFAISTAFTAPVVLVGSAQIYLSDILAALIFVRGALPRARVPARPAITRAEGFFFALWALLMIIAAVRAMNVGVPFPSAIRGVVALAYYPLLFVGVAQVLREVDLKVPVLWRNLLFVALGLTAWMFAARALNHPFNDPGLAEVPTGPGQTVLRNFGFAGAFIIYPVVALVGIAGMAHGARQPWRWLALASVGTLATLATLIRGEIFGLALGALVIVWVRPHQRATSQRARTVVQLSLAIIGVTVVLVALNPKLGHAIVQRALPFTHQSEGAQLNAKYRRHALDTGIRVARQHPFGLGVLDTTRLDARHIDRGYIAHSGVAAMLLFAGWIGLAAALLTVLFVIAHSFRAPASEPWLHPALVGILVCLSAYTVSSIGLVGDASVVALAVIAVALRFAPLDR
jgi:hypothetical protein